MTVESVMEILDCHNSSDFNFSLQRLIQIEFIRLPELSFATSGLSRLKGCWMSTRLRIGNADSLRAQDILDNLPPRIPRWTLPTLNRSPNRLEVTAPILAVHAWPARARTVTIFLLSFLFFSSISSISLTSEFALSALHVARIMRTGNYGAGPLPPRLARPSLPFSLRMRSMLTFRSPRQIVSSTSYRTPNTSGASRHDGDTSSGRAPSSSFRSAAADGATCRSRGSNPVESYHRERKLLGTRTSASSVFTR